MAQAGSQRNSDGHPYIPITLLAVVQLIRLAAPVRVGGTHEHKKGRHTMPLLKIGSRFVNPDTITEIRDLGDVLQVYFAIATGKAITMEHTEFTGHDATALRWWLERNSIDVLVAMQKPEEKQ